MYTVTTETGSIAIPVRMGDPLFSTLANIRPLSEDAPLYRETVATLGLPGQLTGSAPVIVGQVLG